MVCTHMVKSGLLCHFILKWAVQGFPPNSTLGTVFKVFSKTRPYLNTQNSVPEETTLGTTPPGSGYSSLNQNKI